MATSSKRAQSERNAASRATGETESAQGARKPADGRARRRADARGRRSARPGDERSGETTSSLGAPIEFDAEHNPLFGRLGALMTAAGAVAVLVALVGLITLFFAGLKTTSAGWLVLLTLLPPVATAAVGMWTLRAGQRFGLIASTEGSDVGHLMLAIRELIKVYILQLVAFGLGVVALVAVLTLAIVFGQG